MVVETALPRVFWLVLFEAFLDGGAISERPLDSEQTETGEGWNCGEKASSWMRKQRILQYLVKPLILYTSSQYHFGDELISVTTKQLTLKKCEVPRCVVIAKQLLLLLS